MSWVDPATEGGLPVSGEVITAAQADISIQDIEIMQAEILVINGQISSLTAQITAINAVNTSQATTNATYTSEISALQQSVAILQQQLASLTGSGTDTGIVDVATGIVGTAYSTSFNASSDTTAQFSIGSGSLPPGLNLSLAGVLSGTPTTPGNYGFVVNISTNAGVTTTFPLSCSILASVGSALPIEIQIGTQYQTAFTRTGATTFSVFSGSLPPNMSLSNTGNIFGTPTTAGTFPFEIAIVDTSGTVFTPQLTFVVATAAVPVAIPANTLAPVISGTAAVGQTFTASDGSWTGAPPGYTYQWNSAGVAVPNATNQTYVVQSTDAGNIITCTVTATNAEGPSSITTAGKSIPPAVISGTAPTFTADTPPLTAALGVTYGPYNFTASGSPAPTFSLGSGALPTGISLLATGVLSGTPTSAAGTYTFTVLASNGVSPPAVSPTVSLVVSSTTIPSFTAQAPPAGIVGTAYSYTFGITGTPTPTLTVTSGTLPAGLSLSGGNTLSGVPTTAQTYNFILTLANSAGDAVSNNLTVTIAANSAIPAFVAQTPPNGTVGTVYGPYTFTATGSPAPTFANVTSAPTNTTPPTISDTTSGDSVVTSGDTLVASPGVWTGGAALPPGLSIAPTTGILSGTPTLSGSYVFEVQATNSAGAAIANPSVTIAASASNLPTVVTPPAITGTLALGNILTCSAGVWTNSITTAYTSGFEDGTVDNWISALTATVALSTTQFHTGTSSLKVTSTASGQMGTRLNINQAGLVANQVLTVSTWVYSSVSSGTRQLFLQYNAENAAGTVQGQTTGTTLTVAPNTWTNLTLATTASATTTQYSKLSAFSTSSTSGDIFYLDDVVITEGYAYQWNRAGAAISGATSATYTIASADVGQTLTCTVTATNLNGATPTTTAGVIA